jgi:hypothetical protein
MGTGPAELSRRANGDRLIGIAGPFAEELYGAGTPPVHGLAARAGIAPWIADIVIGDRLRVQRLGNNWEVTDERGRLGLLRWRPSDDGRRHAVTGVTITLPASGTLYVQRLVVDQDDRVKDIGGYVEPD